MRTQHSPYQPQPCKYGAAAQDPLPKDTSKQVSPERITIVQQVVGGVLYYARAVDCTVLTALSSIASKQTVVTERTKERVRQLLDYLASKPDATVRYHASDMVLNIHSDASYLSESRARSRAARHYFMGSVPEMGKPIQLNGNILVVSSVLRFVVSSTAEAELGALSSMEKRPRYSVSHSTNSATHNLQHKYTETTRQSSA